MLLEKTILYTTKPTKHLTNVFFKFSETAWLNCYFQLSKIFVLIDNGENKEFPNCTQKG